MLGNANPSPIEHSPESPSQNTLEWRLVVLSRGMNQHIPTTLLKKFLVEGFGRYS